MEHEIAAIKLRLKELKKEEKEEDERLEKERKEREEEEIMNAIRMQIEMELEGWPLETSLRQVAAKWGVSRESIKAIVGMTEGKDVRKTVIEKFLNV